MDTLQNFKKIDPCGIKNSYVTSVASLKEGIKKIQVDEILQQNIFRIFN